MKKAIAFPLMAVLFIMGILLSDLIKQGVNGLLGTEIATVSDLKDKLKDAETKQKETDQKAADAEKRFNDLADKTTLQKENLDKLLNEMNTKVNAGLIRDILLTTPSSETGEKGEIFLNPQGTESLLKPTTSDDPTVDQFKKTFNNKAKDILDVSKGIMKEKLGRLNQEVMRINDELKDRNVELIGKLREEEKYKTQIGQLNTQLVSANQQLQEKNTALNEKLLEVAKYKNELEDKNTKLNDKLLEVDKYKKELEEHRKYINDLEGVKSNLEKTVGVLETKIEDGRLKVSFKGDILFTSGEHKLKSEGKTLLNDVFDILQKSLDQNDIFIAGHTDNVPIREDARERYESNWVLSTYRAVEVVKYLVEKGMDPQKLTAAGYGEFKPVAPNATPEGKTKNRRVELFLIPRIIKR